MALSNIRECLLVDRERLFRLIFPADSRESYGVAAKEAAEVVNFDHLPAGHIVAHVLLRGIAVHLMTNGRVRIVTLTRP